MYKLSNEDMESFGSKLSYEDYMDSQGNVVGFRIDKSAAHAASYVDSEFDNVISEEIMLLVRSNFEFNVTHEELTGECEFLACSWREVVVSLQKLAEPDCKDTATEIFKAFLTMSDEDLKAQIDGICASLR